MPIPTRTGCRTLHLFSRSLAHVYHGNTQRKPYTLAMMKQCIVNYQHELSNTTHLLSYDLCPLFSSELKFELEEDTPPTHTKYVYNIALGKGIAKDGTLPAHYQCPANSFICMTVINTKPDYPSEPLRILQVVPVVSEDIQPKFRLVNTTTGSDIQETHLQLTLHGLKYMEQKQRAVFHLICDQNSDEKPTTPKLESLYRWNGTHVFNWRSNHACPEVRALPTPQEPERENGDDDETMPPADPEPEENYPSVSKPSTLWPVGALIICLAVMSIKWLSVRPRFYAFRFQNWVRSSYDIRSHEHDFLLEEVGSGNGLINDGQGHRRESHAISRNTKYTN